MQAPESSHTELEEAQDCSGELAGIPSSLVRSRSNAAPHSNHSKPAFAASGPPNVLPRHPPPSAATAASLRLQSSTAECDSGQTDFAITSLARSAGSSQAGRGVASAGSAPPSGPSSLPRSYRISPSIAARLPSYEVGVLGAADPSGGYDGGQNSTSDSHASSAVDGRHSPLHAGDGAVPHQIGCALACFFPHSPVGLSGFPPI